MRVHTYVTSYMLAYLWIVFQFYIRDHAIDNTFCRQRPVVGECARYVFVKNDRLSPIVLMRKKSEQ